MLRIFVLILGIVLVGIGLFLLISGRSDLFQPALIWGIILVAAVLCERWRYRRRHDESAQWQRTGERFQDPETGETVEVEYDPLTGERRYVPAKDHHPPPPA
jgi:hypothetical protein